MLSSQQSVLIELCSAKCAQQRALAGFRSIYLRKRLHTTYLGIWPSRFLRRILSRNRVERIFWHSSNVMVAARSSHTTSPIHWGTSNCQNTWQLLFRCLITSKVDSIHQKLRTRLWLWSSNSKSHTHSNSVEVEEIDLRDIVTQMNQQIPDFLCLLKCLPRPIAVENHSNRCIQHTYYYFTRPGFHFLNTRLKRQILVYPVTFSYFG